MYLAYSLLLSTGLLLLSPYFLFQALAHRKYVAGLRERLAPGDVFILNEQDITICAHRSLPCFRGIYGRCD